MTSIFNEKTEIKGTVDTGAEVSKQGGKDSLQTTDVTAIQLLIQILTVLKKIEYHLSIASGTNLSDQDV